MFDNAIDYVMVIRNLRSQGLKEIRLKSGTGEKATKPSFSTLTLILLDRVPNLLKEVLSVNPHRFFCSSLV
jgi:hypothetical protein